MEQTGILTKLKLNTEVSKQVPETARGKHHKIFEIQEPDQLMSSRIKAKDTGAKAPECSLEDVHDQYKESEFLSEVKPVDGRQPVGSSSIQLTDTLNTDMLEQLN